MSETERQTYLTAVQTIKARPPGDQDAAHMDDWNYDQYVRLHIGYGLKSHFVVNFICNLAKQQFVTHSVCMKPKFYPWHRMIIYKFEEALQKIDPSITLPFWDWTLDYNDPTNSIIFRPEYFGGDGDPNNHNCIKDGIAKNWTLLQPYSRTDKNISCVMRCFEFTGLYSPEILSELLSNACSYDGFRGLTENGPHRSIHMQVAGSCGDLRDMYSTNDPLFFLHHSMIDRMWWRFQTHKPQFLNSFNEPHDEIIQPFNVTFSQIASIQGDVLCYAYGPSPSDVYPLKDDMPCIKNSSTLQYTSQNDTNTTINALSSNYFWLYDAIKELVPNGNTDKIFSGSQ